MQLQVSEKGRMMPQLNIFTSAVEELGRGGVHSSEGPLGSLLHTGGALDDAAEVQHAVASSRPGTWRQTEIG